MSASKTPARILLLVSGSIAAFKAVALCSKLVQAGFDVEVAMSQNALQFIGVASFEGITRKKVHVQNFEVGSMMAHIDLERNCDLILNYPSTATTLSHFVHGNGSELLGAIFSAHEFKKPFWIAPAMNQAMIANPATEENLNFLGRKSCLRRNRCRKTD
jgi:phosphopantothenoylcysteine synthetase/decarboxylase